MDAIDQIKFDAALYNHLRYNHYPPLPYDIFGPICKQAIDLANREEWDTEIALPDTIQWKGKDSVPVHAVIEEFHLDFWIEAGDSDDYYMA